VRQVFLCKGINNRVKFDKLIQITEARDMDLRKIHNQQGPKGMPQQSTVHGLGFYKREDDTERKMYDARGMKNDVLGHVVPPKPVRETEAIVYDGMMVALGNPETKKIIEDTLEEYTTLYVELESALTQEVRASEELSRVHESVEKMEETPFSQRKPGYDFALKGKLIKIQKLKEEIEKYNAIITENSKLMEQKEDAELYTEDDEYIEPKLGSVYSTIYSAIETALKQAQVKIKAAIPADKLGDKDAMGLAIKSLYGTNARAVYTALVAFRSKNGGETAKEAFKKFKENILAKRSEAKSGISRRFMKFDPVIALNWVLKYVGSGAKVEGQGTAMPTVDIKGAYKTEIDPRLQQVIFAIKQDKSKRDRKTLIAALAKLSEIPGTQSAMDSLERYIRGDTGITEGDILRELRAAHVE
jgi:hypothetical protein